MNFSSLHNTLSSYFHVQEYSDTQKEKNLMDRDMDAVREIVIVVKNATSSVSKIEGMPDDTFKFNAMLLIEANLALGNVAKSGMSSTQIPNKVVISRLTWQGCDFADSIKDKDIWEKAKTKVLKPAGSWTFEILTEFLKHEMRTKLGLFL